MIKLALIIMVEFYIKNILNCFQCMKKERKKEGKINRNKSFDKEKFFPLNAQESVAFKFRLQQFKKWFEQEFSE